jgi:hypothetical protein
MQNNITLSFQFKTNLQRLFFACYKPVTILMRAGEKSAPSWFPHNTKQCLQPFTSIPNTFSNFHTVRVRWPGDCFRLVPIAIGMVLLVQAKRTETKDIREKEKKKKRSVVIPAHQPHLLRCLVRLRRMTTL